MIGSARLGERRLLAAAGGVRLGHDACRGRGRARRRRAAGARHHRGWKDGVYEGEAFLDDDGHGFKDIHIRATHHQARQRPRGRPDRQPSAGGGLRQLVLRQHALGRGRGAGLSDRSRHAEERRRVPPAQREAQGRHGRVAAARRAGHAVHQPLRPGDHRGDHPGAGAGLSGARHGRLGPALPHRHPGRRPAHVQAVHLAPVPGAAGRRRLLGGRRLAGRRRVAGGGRHQVRQHRGARGALSRCSSAATSSAPTAAATAAIAAARARELEMAIETARAGRRQHGGRRRQVRRLRHCSAVRTACRTTTGCSPRAAPTGRSRPRKPASCCSPGDVLHVRSGGGGGWGEPAERTRSERARARCRARLRLRSLRRRCTMYRIGIDVGGTFTDLVAVDDEGRVTIAKAASTPGDQSLGVMDGLDRLAEALSLDRAAHARAQRRSIVHGTTVATNALLEHKGAKVGLLTTEGHRDVVEMREGLKDDRYNLRQPPPVQLVPRAAAARRARAHARRRPHRDRRSTAPRSTHAIADAGARQASRRSPSATCTAGATTRTSARPRKRVRAAMPDAYVCRSSEVLPQIKEYERVCTTVVNAYVGPVLERYLTRLATRLREAGFAGPVLIIQSHGGVSHHRRCRAAGGRRVLSGPAGGVAGSRYAARLIEHGDLIPFDMGGTSTDISLDRRRRGGHLVGPPRSPASAWPCRASTSPASAPAAARSPASMPAASCMSVPRAPARCRAPPAMAAAAPHATVTDANLVLGYLDPDNFLGGRSRLDRGAAEARRRPRRASGSASTAWPRPRASTASSTRAWPRASGWSRCGAASIPGASRILSFGGAAGLHVTDVARQLDLRRVIVPRLAAVLSAWGMLALRPALRDRAHPHRRRQPPRRRQAARSLPRDGGRGPRAPGRGVPHGTGPRAALGRHALRRADLRGQRAARRRRLRQPRPRCRRSSNAFHARHEELYTYALARPGGRAGQRARGGRRRAAGPAAGAEPCRRPPAAAAARASPRSTSATGARCRSTISTRWRRARSSQGPRSSNRPRRRCCCAPGDRASTHAFGWLDIDVG